jgi:3-deoxy-D-manno-octulosonic-acid transferase
MGDDFPSLRLRFALLLYCALWWIGLPIILLYLRLRGAKDRLYSEHFAERFGRCPAPQRGSVWVHAVSLGELRSAVPLIRALRARGERVVITTFTPAGRREAAVTFATEIVSGEISTVWVPFEYGFAYRRFLAGHAPKYGLVMEVEIWPCMIMSCRSAGVPLFMCNAQYPSKSMARDSKRLRVRSELMRGFAGAMVKSDLQRDRFATVGVANIAVTGELRFDQPIPPKLIAAGLAARKWLSPSRQIIAITSVVEGEDSVYIGAILSILDQAADPPLIIYVPRAPERFGQVRDMLNRAGLPVAARSDLFDAALAPTGQPPDIDVLIGDSMGEMYFYLAMADRVVVGGGFTPHGAHNIIEALTLQKPVIVGPEIQTIEYPAVDAIAAGVCVRVQSPEALVQAMIAPRDNSAIDEFVATHAGAVQRTLDAIDGFTSR